MDTSIEKPKKQRVKYYSMITASKLVGYIAINSGGRTKFTSQQGVWVDGFELSHYPDPIPCTSREAVDCYGKHPTW